jgi:hypothetical protein
MYRYSPTVILLGFQSQKRQPGAAAACAQLLSNYQSGNQSYTYGTMYHPRVREKPGEVQ